MKMCLPPGTESHPQTGTLSMHLTTTYLNVTAHSIKYSLKLWGIPDDFNLDPISHPTDSQRCESYERSFRVTTNLSKLTNYFSDMSVIVISLKDARTLKQIGTGYLKIKRYIINGRLTEFQERMQIFSCTNKEVKKIIGQVLFKLALNVPEHSISKPQSQMIELTNPQARSDVPERENILPNIKPTARQGNARKIVVEQHIFDENNNDEDVNHFMIHKEHNEDHRNMTEGIGSGPVAGIKVKPKADIGHVLDQLGQSMHKYPSIEDLTRKYGRNNVCAERMRLKLDEAKYLNKQEGQQKNGAKNGTGYLIKFKNFDSNPKNLQGIKVTCFESERDLKLISLHQLNDISEGGFYIKKLNPGNLIEFENKIVKGKTIIKKINFSGETFKISLKRKDNNKKVYQFDIQIQELGNLDSKLDKRVEVRREGDTLNPQKHHFYVSIMPLQEKKHKKYSFTLHPGCEEKPVQGRKMAFVSANNQESIKILIETDNEPLPRQISVSVNSAIKMREERVSLNGVEFLIFVASADTIENLMKIVVLCDSKQNAEKLEVKKFQEQKQPEIDDANQAVDIDSRQSKLKILFLCFECLLETTDSECIETIEKLCTVSLTYRQQLNMFERLCFCAGMGGHSKAASQAFQSIMHGEFSMFWTCFQQYKNWNQLYRHSLTQARKQLLSLLKDCKFLSEKPDSEILSEARQQSGKKIIQVLKQGIEKLYRHKQTLFGLIPYEACEAFLNDYLQNHLVQRNKAGHFQFSNVSDDQLLSQKLINVLSTLRNALLLLCRYSLKVNGNPQIHWVKIDEIANFFIAEDRPVFLNLHQVMGLTEGNKEEGEEPQLLFQVCKSCTDGIDHLGDCSGYLIKIISEYKMRQSQSNSQVQSQSMRLQTQNDNNLKMQTEGQERFGTQSEAECKGKQYSDLNNVSQLKDIELYIWELNFVNQNVIQNTHTLNIQILDLKSKACVLRIRHQQLPTQLHLKVMQEYQVVVSQSLQPSQEEIRFEGLFIASEKIGKVILYHRKEGGLSQIGSIVMANQLSNGVPSNQDQIAVLVANKVEFPKYQIPISNIPRKQQQMWESQAVKDITKRNNNEILTGPVLWYKILSIWPAPRSDDQYLLQIQGAEQVIRFPLSGVCGKINNCDPSKEYLDISIENVGNLQKISHVMIKGAGVQQICFNKLDGSAACLCTIELSEYMGNQLMELQQSHLQKVIVLNVYHLESIAKLQMNDWLTLVITTESSEEPLFVKDFSPRNQHYSGDQLRSIWVGISTKVCMGKKYEINIYCKTRKNRYSEEDLIAHFQFQMKFHPNQVGIFHSKGYLIDKKGYRLAIAGFQLNYNDVFSQNPVGRCKFEALFTVFTVENLLKLSQACKTNKELEGGLRSNFGFNNTQIYLLLSLQQHETQIFDIIKNWDIDEFVLDQETSLHSLSIEDLYSEFQIYDFTSSGIIPSAKLQIVNALTLGKTNSTRKEWLDICSYRSNAKAAWVHDLNALDQKAEADYLLVLWCLRKYSVCDNFFFSQSGKPDTKAIHNETTNNDTLIGKANQEGSNIKVVRISLLAYKNLKINNLPATLAFYINGEKVAEPVPRCFTHTFQNPNAIVTRWPILLEVYNKVYGVRELYSEELVGSTKIYEQKVSILGGEAYFMIEDESGNDTNSLIKSQTRRESGLNYGNSRRQRRERWQNLKKSRVDAHKIATVLSSFAV